MAWFQFIHSGGTVAMAVAIMGGALPCDLSLWPEKGRTKMWDGGEGCGPSSASPPTASQDPLSHRGPGSAVVTVGRLRAQMLASL